MIVTPAVPSEEYAHPLDPIESIAEINDWPCSREDDEVIVDASGDHANYTMAFNWMDVLRSIHIAVSFEFKPPAHRSAEIEKLLRKINEQLWIGHFDLWADEGVLMFRHAHVLAEDQRVPHDVAQALMSTAIESCNQFYAAFQHVAWSDCSAETALRSVLFETVGEA